MGEKCAPNGALSTFDLGDEETSPGGRVVEAGLIIQMVVVVLAVVVGVLEDGLLIYPVKVLLQLLYTLLQ